MGVATAGLACVPTATAEENIVEKFSEGLQQRRYHDWSIDRWLKYVEDIGVKYGNNRIEPGNEISTRIISGFEKSDLTLTMTYYELTYHDVPQGPVDYDRVELHWEFDSGLDDSNTGKPDDLAKIGFSPDDFDKPQELDGDEWYNFGPDTTSAGIDAVSDGGIVGEWNGYYVDPGLFPITDGETGGDAGLEDYMSVYLTPYDKKSYDDLTIHFAYSNVFDTAEFDAIGFSSDGVIGYTISDEEDSWTVNLSYEAADIMNGKVYNP
ncbi:MAG: hypothetical protein V5A27_05440 [Halapricum sp.]